MLCYFNLQLKQIRSLKDAEKIAGTSTIKN